MTPRGLYARVSVTAASAGCAVSATDCRDSPRARHLLRIEPANAVVRDARITYSSARKVPHTTKTMPLDCYWLSICAFHETLKARRAVPPSQEVVAFNSTWKYDRADRLLSGLLKRGTSRPSR